MDTRFISSPQHRLCIGSNGSRDRIESNPIEAPSSNTVDTGRSRKKTSRIQSVRQISTAQVAKRTKEKCKSGESPKAARFISGSSRIPVPRRVSHAFASPVILYASCAANATSGNYAIRVRASLDSVYHLNGILRTARKFPIMSLLRGITLGVP